MNQDVVFSDAADAVIFLIQTQAALDGSRKLYQRIYSNELALDWNTQGEMLVEITEQGVALRHIMEVIIEKMSLHAYPLRIPMPRVLGQE